MNDERLLTPGTAPRLAALAALLCVSLLAPAGVGARQQAAAGAAKEETVDSLLTGAGTLALVRVGEEADLQLELRLDGKRVADAGSMYGGFKAHFRGLDSGEVVVMWASEGGTACPARDAVPR